MTVPRWLLVVPALLLLAACAPDATRARIEPDVATTYVNAVQLGRRLQDLPPAQIDVTTSECHNLTDPAADSGPGSWQCDLAVDLAGKPSQVSLILTVDTLGCYAAVDGAHHDRTVTDHLTGAVTGDPAVGFDGCFDTHG